MGNMRGGQEAPVKTDKLVWIKGNNGVEMVKKLSAIQYRVDVQILGDYQDGDMCFNDPDNKPKRSRKKVVTPESEATLEKE
jgi:hypothetical protein